MAILRKTAFLLHATSNFRHPVDTISVHENHHRPLRNIATFPFKSPYWWRMESPDPREVFIESRTTTCPEQMWNTENDDVPDEEDFDDDCSQFTTATIDDLSPTDIYGLPELPPTDEEAAEPSHHYEYKEVETSFVCRRNNISVIILTNYLPSADQSRLSCEIQRTNAFKQCRCRRAEPAFSPSILSP